MTQGRFITIEGGEGSGKSTQIRHLLAAFEQAGQPAIHTREPGGTESAEEIRSLLVRGDAEKWDPVAETLLFYASRREHMAKKVWPALDEGTHVVCDRWADSTRVYQGVGKGMGANFVQALHSLTLGDCEPHLTLWLDIDPKEGLARANGGADGGETRFESMDFSFHEAVRNGFALIAEQNPERMVRIDASKPLSTVHLQVIDAMNRRLGLGLSAAKMEKSA